MKYIFFVLGIFILTFGIAFTIFSDLGTSLFDALLVGLSQSVGLTVGSWEIIIGLLMIVVNALLIRQRPEVLGVITAFVTGIGIDFWLFLFSDVMTPEVWYTKLLVFSIGIIVVGLGTAIYLHTNFAPIPVDRLTLIIKDLFKTNLFVSRTLIYLMFLVLAFIFHGPIGVGTILTVCLGGLILNFFMPIVEKVLDPIIVRQAHMPSK